MATTVIRDSSLVLRQNVTYRGLGIQSPTPEKDHSVNYKNHKISPTKQGMQLFSNEQIFVNPYLGSINFRELNIQSF